MTASTSHPLGPTLHPDGIGFSVYARAAAGMELLLFDEAADAAPARVIRLDPAADRTGPYWHAFVPGVRDGQVYAWRADGPWAPHEGLRFDGRLPLLDPYAPGVAIPEGYRRAGLPPDGSLAGSLKSVVVDLAGYDWEGDAPLGRPLANTIIYEAHLRGMTAAPGSPAPAGERGTYRGFVHAIPYLRDLGVTAVELMPVFAFDRLAAPPGLVNHWGYQPVSFFAPHPGYASRPDARAAWDELRDLVKALHRAGLEVILDVVYNHTAEGRPEEPTFSLRGLANDDYYTLDAADRSRYVDVTGCGNTIDAGSPVARRLIKDSLRFWVEQLHVDGFRFDLAAVLARDSDGRPAEDPATILEIDTDPVLAGTKLIAEPWDAGGSYLVGRFAGDRWVEWNGRFRDDLRSFVKSDPGRARDAALRLLGSPDLYGGRAREAAVTIDFVTCHDGMTLNDLVTYDRKRNLANREGGRDGTDDDRSWGCGADGPTDDPAVNALRARQVRNLLGLTLLSVGVPMLSMGDEVRRTQLGNNNAYCHDDATTWFDWSLVERHADLLAFTRGLIALRWRLRQEVVADPAAPLGDAVGGDRVTWSGVRHGEPDLSETSRSFALTLHGRRAAVHMVCNAFWEPLAFELPPDRPGLGPWRVVLDTQRPAGTELAAPETAPLALDPVPAGPRSMLILLRTAEDAA